MKEVKFIEVCFENMESIVIPIERVESFKHGKLELFERLMRDFKLDHNVYITDEIYMKIKYNNKTDLEYKYEDYNEPLGMFIGNQTSNNVGDRPNILGRILNGKDIVDIYLLDENEEEIQNIYAPWGGDSDYRNDFMSVHISDGFLEIHIKDDSRN